MNKKNAYGWRKDLPDQRDYKFKAKKGLVIPKKVDLRSKLAKKLIEPNLPTILDQGQLGSCVFNSSANAIRFVETKQAETQVMPSRLFMYYNTRVLEGTVASDAGASIRDAMKVISKQGYCDESLWAYDIKQFKKKPPTTAYADATKRVGMTYQTVAQTKSSIKACLASGLVFVAGISVYSSFESDAVAKTGIVPIPAKNESLLGGHAILVVGYDDSKSRWICMNSWGTTWGDNGFFYLPYTYLTNTKLSSDFWTIQRVA